MKQIKEEFFKEEVVFELKEKIEYRMEKIKSILMKRIGELVQIKTEEDLEDRMVIFEDKVADSLRESA